MDLGLSGRKAIICASSRGLGKGCAIALAQAGVFVVINGRHREPLETTAREIREAAQIEVTPVLAELEPGHDAACHVAQQAGASYVRAFS